MLSASLHQSSEMSLAINLVAVLLACFAAATAVPANFPHGKTLVYKYYGDVKAGTIEPAPYASQFALEATLYVKHDTSDSSLKNAYYVALKDVKTGMHNGIAAHYQRTKVLKPITEAAKTIEQTFMIVYDENGKLEGVKIPADETGWSKNMKMAIASMLQLDLPSMKFEEEMMPRSFISKENTIHGDCWTTYDVHTKDPRNLKDPEIVVTKFSSPMNCTGFAVHEFNHVEQESCQVEKEEPMNVASRRLFEIEKQGEDILIKKLVAHGGSNYFPWNARSEAHYVMTNATFTLDRVASAMEINLPAVNFLDVPLIRDMTYRKPEGHYATNAMVDVTQGRHVVNLEKLVTKLRKMLGEAADYLDENHLEDIEPDWKHGQTINRILHTMSYMDVASFEQVLSSFPEASPTPKDVTSKNIFLRMISKVGTTASCIFTLNMIRTHKLSDLMASAALHEMPMHVKRPDVELLLQMEDMLRFGDSMHYSVRMASILCFSNFIYRTFKETPNPKENETLQKYIRSFYHSLRFEQDTEMKLNYMMALSNIQVGGIPELLEHSVRGIVDFPEEMRLHVIWAIRKAVENDYRYAQDLLWPVMADKSLSAKLRIAAYEILMHQASTMTDVLKIYWFMVYESNEHLYNYHYTTLQGIANSVDPCRPHLRELARKIMRFTKVHPTIPYKLSSAMSVGYKDEKYNHAERFDMGMMLNENTGVPEVVTFKHIVTDGRKPVINHEIRLQVLGCDEIISKLTLGNLASGGRLTSANVLDVLRQAASALPTAKRMHVDIIVIRNGRIVLAKHFDGRVMARMVAEGQRLGVELPTASWGLLAENFQFVSYEDLYEYQVTSDMGLPVVMETRVPFVTSFKLNAHVQPEVINVELDAKIWRHGDYSMSIYNPMADVWHAVRRSTATDVSFPIHVSIAYNPETHTLKINYPRLPTTKLSIGGAMTHAKDCVTVNEDDLAALKQSCDTCNHHEVVTTGMPKKKYSLSSLHSKDTGLHYSMAIFDCENDLTPVTLSADWYRAFMSERKSTWNDWIMHGILATRQHMKNMLISPRVGSCGTLVKVEPSIVHPTSRIDLSLRASYEDVDHVNPSYHYYGSQKYNFRSNVDIIAAATNTSARSWDLNVNVDLEQGHRLNTAKLHLTRTTPGETNLKICVDAQKTYSPVPPDPLRLGVAKEETNSKLTIAVGRTNEDKCVRDDTLVTMTVKGELSDEQKKKYSQEMTTNACREDMKNTLYATPKSMVPRTLNCLNHVIKYTTLRKYTINVTHKKVPEEVTSRILNFEDILRSYLLPNLEYRIDHTLPGSIKMNAEFPMEKDLVDVSVVTPTRSYDLVDVELEKPGFKGFGLVVKPAWQWPLENTRFNLFTLDNFVNDKLKMCSIYPQTVLTADGKNVPFGLTDQWTLITGDHLSMNFAMFAKMVGTNMAVKIYHSEDDEVEIMPNADNSVKVTVSGEVVSDLNKGIVVPFGVKNWRLRITKSGDSIYVRMKGVPMLVVHGMNHVALGIDSELQGRVSGLCGHLDGSYLNTIDKTFTLPRS